MRIVFYISGHGLGHAARDIELVHAIARGCPDAQFILRTSVSPWLFAIVRAPFELQPAVVDTGLVQLDSLRFDERASATEAQRFYQDFDRRIDEEVAVLRNAAADLVIGDIPPLAFAAAERAGLPSVAVSNFTWDWIYSAYPQFDAVRPTIEEAYKKATCTLRLPFHGGFESMAPTIVDIPLIARHATRPRAETRRLLGAPDNRPLVLASFGAYGAAIPLERLTRSRDFTVIEFERHPPHGLAYPDIVAAADVVITKPGYGIVSECIANDTAMVYTSRGRFLEYDVFVDEMPRVLRCQFISPEDLLEGRWNDAVFGVLAQPAPPERWPTDGADVAASHILGRARR